MTQMPEGTEFTSFSFVDNIGCGCTCPGCIIEHGFAPCDKEMFMNEKGEIFLLEELPRNSTVVEYGRQTVAEFLNRNAVAEFAGAPYICEELPFF
jgi:hypothetical protein